MSSSSLYHISGNSYTMYISNPKLLPLVLDNDLLFEFYNRITSNQLNPRIGSLFYQAPLQEDYEIRNKKIHTHENLPRTEIKRQLDVSFDSKNYDVFIGDKLPISCLTFEIHRQFQNLPSSNPNIDYWKNFYWPSNEDDRQVTYIRINKELNTVHKYSSKIPKTKSFSESRSQNDDYENIPEELWEESKFILYSELSEIELMKFLETPIISFEYFLKELDRTFINELSQEIIEDLHEGRIKITTTLLEALAEVSVLKYPISFHIVKKYIRDGKSGKSLRVKCLIDRLTLLKKPIDLLDLLPPEEKKKEEALLRLLL